MRTFFGLAVSLLFLVLFLRQLDIGELLAQLAQAKPSWLLLALTALALDFFLRIWRWARLLSIYTPGLTIRRAAGPFLASFALNNVLPLRAGDLARAFAFNQHLQTDSDRVTASLLIERLLDLGALLVLLCLGLLWYPGDTGFDQLAYVGIGLVFAGMLLLLLAPRTWQRVLARLPAQDNPVMQFGHGVFDALAAVRGLGTWLKLCAMSLAAWLLEGLVFFCGARALTDSFDPLAPWFALALGSLSTLLPSSPGYVGTFDYFTAMGFSLTGTDAALASAMAVLVHLLLWLPVTAVGFLWLLRFWGGGLGQHIRQLRRGESQQ